MRKRFAQEDGWLLVTAMILMAAMMMIALASFSLVDTQQKRTRQQRENESSLNLAEAVLYSHGFKLAQGWPSATKPAQDCTSTAVVTGCPAPADILKNSYNVDTKAASTWSTKVRDNGGQLAAAYQIAYENVAQSGVDASGKAYTCAAPCRYDANGDRKMWVQAKSIVRGRKRTVVATMKLERLPESTPHTAVTAGGINTGNQGSQVKVWGETTANVIVRCNPKNGNGNDNKQCVSDAGGIQPPAVQGNPPPLMTPAQIERFRQRAIYDDTYFAGCPTNWNFQGAVVFIDYCNSPHIANGQFPTYPCQVPLPAYPTAGGGNGLQPDCVNQKASPGLLIWHCGSLDMGGTGTFIGIMYFVNNSDNPTTGPCAGVAPRGSNPVNCTGNQHGPNMVMSTNGGFGVWGALAIDGNGCLFASANGMQVQYDPNVFNAVASYGAVGLVQDTWRELAPS